MTLGDAGLALCGAIAVAALAACNTASDSGASQVFVTHAATGGIAEVEMGKLAGDKAASSEVKKFAVQMVSDHTKANEELEKIATGKSLKVPTALDAEHKAKLETLSKKTTDKQHVVFGLLATEVLIEVQGRKG